MGTITKLLKAGVNNSLNQFKNVNVSDKVSSALDSAGISFKMPEKAKDMRINLDPSVLKLPGGVDNYISPLASAALSKVSIPSSIGGVNLPQLPSMPDLSSVTNQVENGLGKFGFDTDKLGIRGISDILAAPDLKSLKGVVNFTPVDLENMPDLTKSLDGFNVDSIQNEIDNLTGKFPGMEKLDISKYF